MDKSQAIAKEFLEWIDGYVNGVKNNIPLGEEKPVYNVIKKVTVDFNAKFKQILKKHGMEVE